MVFSGSGGAKKKEEEEEERRRSGDGGGARCAGRFRRVKTRRGLSAPLPPPPPLLLLLLITHTKRQRRRRRRPPRSFIKALLRADIAPPSSLHPPRLSPYPGCSCAIIVSGQLGRRIVLTVPLCERWRTFNRAHNSEQSIKMIRMRVLNHMTAHVSANTWPGQKCDNKSNALETCCQCEMQTKEGKLLFCTHKGSFKDTCSKTAAFL